MPEQYRRKVTQARFADQYAAVDKQLEKVILGGLSLIFKMLWFFPAENGFAACRTPVCAPVQLLQERAFFDGE
ncbi:MAG: hypothetical protein U5N26_03005 [Candidatus Marinimicrobia bacterium]|nr:hypothetical protein [Candidatus Neomarinimicrobiota bacterium]